MAQELYANDAATTVPAGADGNSGTETWTVTSSSSFPAASSTATPPSKFHVADPAAPSELILVTNVSGTTWTVTRGAESTTPVTHAAGFTVVQVIPAGAMSNLATYYSGGVYYLDNYTGTDDQKMTAALSDVITAGGGTILLSPRTHTFANQWSTSYVSLTQVTTLRIIGAGASGPGNVANPASGVTKCTFTYNGAGAGQADFQHVGLLEIAGIWFYDTTYTVPFIFTTCPNPYIHDNAFSGPGSRATCTKDAVVLGDGGIGQSGNAGTLGDLSKFAGYAQAQVTRNYFDTIRRAVVFGGGCNGVSVCFNTVSQDCGDSTIAMGAPFYFNGNSTHGSSGNYIFGNYVEMTYYAALTSTNGTAYAVANTIGPNNLWDAAASIGSYWDSTCTENTFVDTSSRTASSQPAIIDIAGTNAVAGGYFASKYRGDVVADGANIVVRNSGGQPAWAEAYSGIRAGMGAATNSSLQAIAQAYTQAGSSVANGTSYSGSPYVVSTTAAWTTNHIGSFIESNPASAGVPSNNRILQVINASSAGFAWQPSTAYTLGAVITPTTGNSHLYQASTGGTTSSSQPTWPTSGGTVTDGSAVWQDLGISATAVLCSQNATQTATSLTLAYRNPAGAVTSMTQFNNHHIIGTGGAPSWAVGTTAIAGTGATVTVTGNDISQIVTFNSGTGVSSAGMFAQGTPANTFSSSGSGNGFAVTAANGSAATLMSSGGGVYATFAGNKWNLFSVTQVSSSTTYIFNINTVG